jgi:hypothetical protein
LKYGIDKEQAENIKQLLMGKIQETIVMSTDFSLPQRQSVVGIWVLFFIPSNMLAHFGIILILLSLMR